jgi:hypothetical protein
MPADYDSLSEGVDALVETQRSIGPLLENCRQGGGIGIPNRRAADQDVVAAATNDAI